MSAFTAVLVTAVMASALGSLVIVSAIAVNLLIDIGPGIEKIGIKPIAMGFSGAMFFVLLGMMWGLIWSLPCAAIIAVFEWPKARWLVRREGYFFAHVVSSILVAMALSVVLPAIDFFDLEAPLSEIAEEPWLHTIIFAVGGISSAIAWWFLVISPTRGAELRSVERAEAEVKD